ncbi:hypothetical protein [Paenibacillus radicis (ex Gao et al. 2016)]|uniref:DUF559 domain-containing protein n=1 Tax=Paenibacillus radicis (ex Gao et al. 2016) TaxID=1737354 RepID=A0A917HFW3_9BACL|nr:hypothetical protein [Paenibacillus radicis (ex Gao et al. 2016)]GGG77846.1 hypothetical protein GCM10010918_38290 [Paenibacillus radicis (ex Gao et al. 2016)]
MKAGDRNLKWGTSSVSASVSFEQAHEAFLLEHTNRRQGERKGRLVRGHQYAEKLLLQNVWWPLFGSFENLHPEYEVLDWNRKSQFLDFAYITPFGQFGLECDGYQSHIKDMDRERFSYSLNRETFLTGLGWRMIHFSFDDVQKRPEVCRMLLQHAIGPAFFYKDNAAGASASSASSLRIERELLQAAWRFGGVIRPKEAREYLDVDFRTARKHLQAMVVKGLLQPVSEGKQIRSYEVKPGALEQLLLR